MRLTSLTPQMSVFCVREKPELEGTQRVVLHGENGCLVPYLRSSAVPEKSRSLLQ